MDRRADNCVRGVAVASGGRETDRRQAPPSRGREVVKLWTPFERLRIWQPPSPLTERDGSMCFLNSRYSVVFVPLPTGWTWLSIHRRDGLPVRRWRDLQRIKNELAAPER